MKKERGEPKANPRVGLEWICVEAAENLWRYQEAAMSHQEQQNHITMTRHNFLVILVSYYFQTSKECLVLFLSCINLEAFSTSSLCNDYVIDREV